MPKSNTVCPPLVLLIIATASNAWAGPPDLKGILEAPEGQDEQVVLEIVRSGPDALRRLQEQLANQTPSPDESRRVHAILVRSRAQLIGVDLTAAQALDHLRNYSGGGPAHNAIEILAQIMDNGAAKSDYGRAQVLQTLLHIYQVLLDQPQEHREAWKPWGSPRTVLARIVHHDVGPEETAALDANIHLLLYHDWISQIYGIDKFLFRLIESPHLSADSYECFHAKITEVLRGTCVSRKAGATLRRDEPASWPCVPDRLFMPLWNSAHATPKHREALYHTLEDTLLSGLASPATVDTCSKYFYWLRRRNAVSSEQIRAYIDRALALPYAQENGRPDPLLSLFPDVYEACPQWRSEYMPPRRDDLRKWWQDGGRDATWIRPFEKPYEALVVMLVEPEKGKKNITLLQARLSLNAGIVKESVLVTPWGPFDLWVQAWPSSIEEGVTVYDFDIKESGTKSDIPEFYTPYINITHPRRMRGKVVSVFRNIYRPSAQNLRSMMVLLIDEPLRIDEIDTSGADAFLATVTRRIRSGELPHGGFPGDEDVFLPPKRRLRLATRFLEVVEEAQPRPEWKGSNSTSSSFTRLARFACEQGAPYGLGALQTWVTKQWPGWRAMQQAIPECEHLLAAATTVAGDGERIMQLLDQGDEGTMLLLNRDVRERLTAQEKRILAHAIGHRVSAPGEDPMYQFVISALLRELSDEDFGGRPFDSEEQNRQAITRWKEWAAGP